MTVKDIDFIGLYDFLHLPFLNPYSKCMVLNTDDENEYISTITIKDLITEIEDDMHVDLEENFYVQDLMPGLCYPRGGHPEPAYYIYLKRF